MSVVRFGDFEFHPRLRELRRGVETIRLQDQPYHVLSIMLERPGDVVTREDIQARLWPDGTAVDFEHSVNAAIKRLRQALGDDAGRPRYVETLPRLGYRFIAPMNTPGAPGASVAAAAACASRTDERPRLVVLPFRNLSCDVKGDYFSDGLTEELIAQIGRRSANHVAVLARTSSMIYKDAGRGAAEIGDALRADYLVEGSVRVGGDRVRITAQLVETKGETQLWADTYDRDLADTLAVQADVAAEIASALSGGVLPRTGSPALTHNARAYDAYLTGRFHWNKVGDVGLFDAITWYDFALELDPAFAKAHSARARAYLAIADYYLMDPIHALRAARASAERALDLDPADAEAYVVMAEVRRVIEWDWTSARACYQKALALNPSSAGAHRYQAWFIGTRDDAATALAVADRAYDVDPLCFSMLTGLASVRFFQRDFDGALARARAVLNMEPSYVVARRLAAASLLALGRVQDSVAEFDNVPEASLAPADLAWKGHVLASAGHPDRARDARGRLDQMRGSRFVSDYHAALLHVGLQDREAALTSLERACDHKDPWLDAMPVDPRFESIRQDGRFQALCAHLRRGCTSS